MRKRVLIIGAGRRGQNSYLPAFHCLSHLFEVVGLHSRTSARAVAVARKWHVPAVDRLADIDLSTIDLAVVAVPPDQNVAVLQALLPFARGLNILIDTPIASDRKQLESVVPLLEQFESVTVAEDHMNFPFHKIARDAAAEGIIGRPKSLSLLNIGYLYHGLSIIRALTGFAPATGSWNKPLGTHGKVVGFTFADGFTATMIGPYRRQDKVAGLILEGASGIISETAMDANYIGHNRKMYVLQPIRSDGQIIAYSVTGKDYKRVMELPYINQLRTLDFPDKSEINLLQVSGNMDIILSIFHEWNINRGYGYKNGLYDSFAAGRADSGYHQLDTLPQIMPWLAN
jgi:hypothetical protein